MKKENLLSLQTALLGSGILATVPLFAANTEALISSLGISLITNAVSKVDLNIISQMFSKSENVKYRQILNRAIVSSLKEVYKEIQPNDNFIARYSFYNKCKKLKKLLDQAPSQIFESEYIINLTSKSKSILKNSLLSKEYLIKFGFKPTLVDAFILSFKRKIAKKFDNEIRREENFAEWKHYIIDILHNIETTSAKNMTINKAQYAKINEKLDALITIISESKPNSKEVLNVQEIISGSNGLNNHLKSIENKMDEILKRYEEGIIQIQNTITHPKRLSFWQLLCANQIFVGLSVMIIFLLIPIYKAPYNETFSNNQLKVIVGLQDFKKEFDKYCQRTLKEEREYVEASLDSPINVYPDSIVAIDLDQVVSPIALKITDDEYNKLFEVCKSLIADGRIVYNSHTMFLLDQINDFINGALASTAIGISINDYTKWESVYIMNTGKSHNVGFSSQSFKRKSEIDRFNNIFKHTLMLMDTQYQNYKANLSLNGWFRKTTLFRLYCWITYRSPLPKRTMVKSTISPLTSNFNFTSDQITLKIHNGNAVLFIMDPKNQVLICRMKKDPKEPNNFIPDTSEDYIKKFSHFLCVAIDTSFYEPGTFNSIHFKLGINERGPYKMIQNNIVQPIGIYLYVPGFYFTKTSNGIWVNSRKATRNDLINDEKYFSKYIFSIPFFNSK